jgi:hypothetical protein
MPDVGNFEECNKNINYQQKKKKKKQGNRMQHAAGQSHAAWQSHAAGPSHAVGQSHAACSRAIACSMQPHVLQPSAVTSCHLAAWRATVPMYHPHPEQLELKGGLLYIPPTPRWTQTLIRVSRPYFPETLNPRRKPYNLESKP